VVKTDADGNVQWQDVYPPTSVGDTAGEYLGLTSDGGFIVFTDTIAFDDTLGTDAMGFMKIARDTAILPWPSPMTWATVPHVSGPDSVSMTATTAYDFNGVQYYFACTAGDCNDSGWQDGTLYEDTGLSKDIRYAYTVRVRDNMRIRGLARISDMRTRSEFVIKAMIQTRQNHLMSTQL
jgi:hypothetical protein